MNDLEDRISQIEAHLNAAHAGLWKAEHLANEFQRLANTPYSPWPEILQGFREINAAMSAVKALKRDVIDG